MNTYRSQGLRNAVLLVALAVVPQLAAASLRDKNICPSLANNVGMPAGSVVPDVCYSGFGCTVGLRGDWLDLTDRVSITWARGTAANGPLPRVSIGSAGAEPQARGFCVPPSNKTREGYVEVLLQDIAITGDFKLTVHRPGLGGVTRDSNELTITIRDGTRFLNPLATNNGIAVATAGTERILELRGRGLENLRVRPGVTQPFAPPPPARPSAPTPGRASLQATAANLRTAPALAARSGLELSRTVVEEAPFEVLSARYDVVRLKVKVLRPGLVSLGDYLEFAAGDPAINRDFGWPEIEVR